MSFTIAGTGQIKSLSVTKSGGDDEPVVRITIGLAFEEVDGDPIAAALGCELQDLKRFFNAEGASAFTGIESITSWAEYEDQHSVSMLHFTEAVKKVSKIAFTPRTFPQFGLSCSIQIEHPDDRVIPAIAEGLHEYIKIRLVHNNILPLHMSLGDGTTATLEAA